MCLFIHYLSKFGVGKIFFFMFLKEVSYAYQECIYLIRNTVKTVIFWNITFYDNFWKLIVLQLWQSWIFSKHFLYFRNHSNMLICKYELLLLSSMLKTVVQLNIFLWKLIHFFRIFWWIESSEEQQIFYVKLLCCWCSFCICCKCTFNRCQAIECLFCACFCRMGTTTNPFLLNTWSISTMAFRPVSRSHRRLCSGSTVKCFCARSATTTRLWRLSSCPRSSPGMM